MSEKFNNRIRKEKYSTCQEINVQAIHFIHMILKADLNIIHRNCE